MNFSKMLNNYNLNLILGVLLALAFGITAGWFGYSWYSKGYEESAQLDLAEGLEEYNKKINDSESTRTWEDLERAFGHAAKKNSTSKLYPFFLALQADVFIQEKKYENAISTLEQAVKAIDTNQPIYFLYLAKLALLKLDSQDEKIHNSGLEDLIKLSKDKNNPVYTMSLYYLGLDAENRGKLEEAKKYFQEIITFDKDSNWATMAQKRI